MGSEALRRGVRGGCYGAVVTRAASANPGGGASARRDGLAGPRPVDPERAGPRSGPAVCCGRRRFVVGSAAGLLASACKPRGGFHYPGGRTVPADRLSEVVGPRVSAVRVPLAKIRIGGHRGRVSYLAEWPGRFRGTVTVAGNELLSLAFSEAGYQLVDKLADPPGYVEGTDARCAIARLLGVSLAPEAFVSLVCGGAPVAADVVFHPAGYDGRRQAERLRGVTAAGPTEVWIRPVSEAPDAPWVLVGAVVPAGGGGRAEVLYGGWHTIEGVWFPTQWTARSPGTGKDVHIRLDQVDLSPPWAPPKDEDRPEPPPSVADPGKDRDRTEIPGSASAEDPDEGWEEGGAWENEDAPGVGRAGPDAGEAGEISGSGVGHGGSGPSGHARATTGTGGPGRKAHRGPAARSVPARYRLAPPPGLPRRPDPCERGAR